MDDKVMQSALIAARKCVCESLPSSSRTECQLTSQASTLPVSRFQEGTIGQIISDDLSSCNAKHSLAPPVTAPLVKRIRRTANNVEEHQEALRILHQAESLRYVARLRQLENATTSSISVADGNARQVTHVSDTTGTIIGQDHDVDEFLRLQHHISPSNFCKDRQPTREQCRMGSGHSSSSSYGSPMSLSSMRSFDSNTSLTSVGMTRQSSRASSLLYSAVDRMRLTPASLPDSPRPSSVEWVEQVQQNSLAMAKVESADGHDMIRTVTSDGSIKDAIKISKSSVRLQPAQTKVKCKLPGCDDRPQGYKGTHEMLRHFDRAHGNVRQVYVCVPQEDNPRFLIHCKVCTTHRQYNADYNAGEHLRRLHFNPRPKGRRDQLKPEEKRGGRGGGNWPSMGSLRDFMITFEVQADGTRISPPRRVNERSRAMIGYWPTTFLETSPAEGSLENMGAPHVDEQWLSNAHQTIPHRTAADGADCSWSSDAVTAADQASYNLDEFDASRAFDEWMFFNLLQSRDPSPLAGPGSSYQSLSSS